ncbi:MAG: hypothetical protein ACTSSQ_05725 [Alphaproteobacteria bacterium]
MSQQEKSRARRSARQRTASVLCALLASAFAGSISANAASGADIASPAAAAHTAFINGSNRESRLVAEGLDIRLYADADHHGDADWPVPVVEIARDGKKLAELVAGDGGGAYYPTTVYVVELTTANAEPEVVLESYSGGAHCCAGVVASLADESGTWNNVSFGVFDGGGGLIRDVDGDGVSELVARDNAFLYTFGCYACSAAPLQIIGLRDGAIADISLEMQFLPAHRAHLARLEDWAIGGDSFRENGYLAGWVAAKIRVGEGAQAWQRMLKSYNRDDDWGLESCRTGGNIHDCDAADIVVGTFPDVLREFLNAGGYEF